MSDTPKWTAELLAGLRATPSFSGLSESKLEELLAMGEIVRFAAGDAILVEGEAADCSYILLEGTASIHRGGQAVSHRAAGQWLGEVAMLDEPLRSATVRALTPVTALMIRRDVFEAELGSSELARSLLRAMAAKLRQGDVLIKKTVEDLRRLEALKDDLVSMIVHDMRVPLSSLKLAIAAIEGGDTSPQVRGIVSRSAKYIETLVADVLDVCTLEQQEIQLNFETLELASVAREAVESVRAAASVRLVALEVIAPEPCEGRFDRKLVRRAIENLLSNAIKYAPARSPVRVSVNPDGNEFRVDVEDQGPGIPLELRGAIFEKFGSVEAKRGAVRQGYGLGLHLVHLVATAHGGGVQVQDNPSGGSVFRLRLSATA